MSNICDVTFCKASEWLLAVTFFCKNFRHTWDKVFNIGLSQFCGRQPLKNFKGYGLLEKTISLNYFKSCLPQSLPLLNNFVSNVLQTQPVLHRSFSTAWKVSKYRVFSGPYFPLLWLPIFINLLIQPEYRKIRTRKNSVFGQFSSIVRFRKILKSTFWMSLYNIDPFSCLSFKTTLKYSLKSG